jgi:hypothetical protein
VLIPDLHFIVVPQLL